MPRVNLSQAKAHLNALIEAAEKGEQIVIMRGPRPTVTPLRVTESDIDPHPEISLGALSDFEAEIQSERAAGQLSHLGQSESEAISALNAL